MALPPDAYETIAVLTLPVMAMMMYAMVKLGRSPIGQALGRRISGEPRLEQEDRFLEMEERVHDLELQVLETRERLDFAERLLAQADENGTRLLPRAWSDTPDAGVATPV